ncbi:MAG: amino acid permease [Patescibacteria group bacterium]|nr:amino acid permease [Patescibacteria group bacterium]
MAKALKRSLSLPIVTLYGLGNILGAGIYVLVGKVAGVAGYGTTMSFLLAMFVAGLTAFSYMELSGRYPVSASVSVYLHKAFGKRWLSVLIGLAMVAGGIASAAALAQGFSGYLNIFISVPTIVASVGLLVLVGLIAAKGIGESAITAAIFTVIEITGLILVIWAGRGALTQISPGDFVRIDPTLGLSGVVAGAFLAFYAFIGFEDMVNVAEEVKNPRRTMPLAILFSLIASTVLYLLVVIISITIVPPTELATSSAPLALVYEKSGASFVAILSVIGITAAVNGVVVQVIMGSRILYGLSKQGWLRPELSKVNKKTKTPIIATALIVGLMIVATVLLPLVSLAKVTSLLVLSIFTLVNASLFVIKRRQKKHEGYITVPIAIPALGVATSGGLIFYQLIQ